MVGPLKTIGAERISLHSVSSGESESEAIAFISVSDIGAELRNNFGGFLGYKFTLLDEITITHLGRLCFDTNTQTHLVKIVTALDATLASVTVDATGGANDFKWVALITPVVLSAGSYWIGSEENNGGDTWNGTNISTLTPTAIGTVDAAAYWSGGIATESTSNKGYVPPNFKYIY